MIYAIDGDLIEGDPDTVQCRYCKVPGIGWYWHIVVVGKALNFLHYLNVLPKKVMKSHEEADAWWECPVCHREMTPENVEPIHVERG